jgi:hypothetical protein
MSQVLGGQFRLLNPGLHLLIEFIEAAAEGPLDWESSGSILPKPGRRMRE